MEAQERRSPLARYRSDIRNVVGSSASAYGYTLTVWSTGMVLSHAYGPPNPRRSSPSSLEPCWERVACAQREHVGEFRESVEHPFGEPAPGVEISGQVRAVELPQVHRAAVRVRSYLHDRASRFSMC